VASCRCSKAASAGLGRAGLAYLGRGLRHLAQEPEEAPARLFQAGFLGGHRRLHRRAGDQGRARVLSAEKIIFASDCPFDPEGGTLYPRETLRILDKLNIPKADREKIDYKNLEAITGVKLVK